jgi:TRAP transporter TAXI family solute receptor
MKSSRLGGRVMKFCCCALIGTLLAVFWPGFVRAEGTVLKWGAMSVQSGLSENTVAIKRVVNRAHRGKISVTVVASPGYDENLAKLRNNTLQVSALGTAEARAAYTGTMDYQGKRFPELRSLWGGYIRPIHIITSKESKVTSIAELDGLPFAMNSKTSAGRLIKFFLDAQGVKPIYNNMGIAASVDAMKDEVVQCWFKAGFEDAAIAELEATLVINILPITRLMIAKMNAKYPGQALSLTIPAGTFKAIKKDQLGLAYVISDFVRADVADHIVRNIVEAVWNKRNNMVSPIGSLRKGRFADMYLMALDYDLGVPLHSGAAKFYQEKLTGSTIPDKLLPPEMKPALQKTSQ